MELRILHSEFKAHPRVPVMDKVGLCLQSHLLRVLWLLIATRHAFGDPSAYHIAYGRPTQVVKELPEAPAGVHTLRHT
jgi:hypothetical protein